MKVIARVSITDAKNGSLSSSTSMSLVETAVERISDDGGLLVDDAASEPEENLF